jgi:hypothetical protein
MEVKRRFLCDLEKNLQNGDPTYIRIAEIRLFTPNGKIFQDNEQQYRLVTYFPKAPEGKIIHAWDKGEGAVERLYKELEKFAEATDERPAYKIIEQP